MNILKIFFLKQIQSTKNRLQRHNFEYLFFAQCFYFFNYYKLNNNKKNLIPNLVGQYIN